MIDPSSPAIQTDEITPGQARALAELLHQLRPAWVVKSMVTLIGQHRTYAPFDKLALAAVRCALDPKIATPVLIFADGPAWHPPRKPDAAPTPPATNDTSPDCGNHPGVKAWACKPCRVTAPRPANFAEMILASAEAALAKRLASRGGAA